MCTVLDSGPFTTISMAVTSYCSPIYIYISVYYPVSMTTTFMIQSFYSRLSIHTVVLPYCVVMLRRVPLSDPRYSSQALDALHHDHRVSWLASQYNNGFTNVGPTFLNVDVDASRRRSFGRSADTRIVKKYTVTWPNKQIAISDKVCLITKKWNGILQF